MSCCIAACAWRKRKLLSTEKPEGAPDTWIADRTITGLVFQSANDAAVEMNPEIKEYIKKDRY